MKAWRRSTLGKAAFAGSICVLAFMATAAFGFAASAGVEQLANYKGKDREKVLLEGARKEGQLSFYSSMNTRESKPLVENFEKKYPFIKVESFIGRGEDVVNRLIMEQKSGRLTADTFCGTSINIEKIRREGMLFPFYSPAQDLYNKKYIDPNKYWVPIYHNILTFGYNTAMVKDPPKNWQDLLGPAWKGYLAVEDTDEVWLINFWKAWGETKAKDYFTRLGKQALRIVHGHSVLDQMLVTGEVASTPTQYLSSSIAFKRQGAPINFLIMDPMVSSPQGISLLKNTSHPHAALLFIDYVTSKETQGFFYKQGRNAAYPGVDPLLNDANLIIDDPGSSLDRMGYWQNLFKELIITPNKRP